MLLGALYATAGTLVISTTLLPAASGARLSWVVRGMDLAALVSAVVLVAGASRLPARLLGTAVLLSSLMITGAVLASGGGSTAVTYASVYLVGPVYCRFVLTERAANLQLALILALGVPSLGRQPGVGAGEQVILWGVALMLCSAVTWLVRSLQSAETDPHTGLPNRQRLERSLAAAVASAGTSEALVLVRLELDRPRDEGHAPAPGAEDPVVAEVARAWSAVLPPGAVLARANGQGFGLLLPGWTVTDARALVQQLQVATASCARCAAGIVLWERGESWSLLAGRAESAVYAAEREGRDGVFVHPGTDREGREVRTALDQGQFVVHYQPVVAMGSGLTVGAEALVRWQHPHRGLLPPGQFLGEVERAGLMRRLGGVVLRAACTEAATWSPSAFGEALHVSVNASAHELQDPAYADTVADALARSGLPAHQLVVELVESDYDADSPTVVRNLALLRDLGVRTAVDDFGVGHSSLGRLRSVGSDVLKIDRSFVADITDGGQEAPLVLAVLALATALGMRVVAEGVETAVQAEWLRERGCAFAQGWYYSSAKPGREFRCAVAAEAAPFLSA